MRQFKVNKVSVDIQNYLYYIRGLKKTGKTTLFRDLVLELFGKPEKGLLIACKDEVGYKALDNLQAEHVETWQDFEDLCQDLAENKESYGVEFLAIDTVDELVDMAIQRAIKLSVIETGKPCKSINSAFGGFGVGRQRVTTMIKEQLALLKKNGYGLVAIGHTKLRTIKEKGMNDDEGYQQLTSNLSSDYDSIFADIFDVVATINVEKIIENGKLQGTKRYMYFRSDGFVDAGSRFKGMPERVELEDSNFAKNFIDAVYDGIKSSMSVPMNDSEIETQRKKEVKDREKKAREFAKLQKLPTNEELVKIIQDKFSNASNETKLRIQTIMKEFSMTSFANPETLNSEALQKIVGLLN